MGPKRKFDGDQFHGKVHASRQSQVYGGGDRKPVKKPRRFEPPTLRKQAHASSINAIKKRIRDITRRAERAEDLPANVRMEDERALASYRQELDAAQAEKLRQKMIKKYHMVRFFERQKATRHIKKLRKQLLEASSTEHVDKLKAQMHIAEVDLNYTQYYPLSEPYISLYSQKPPNDEDAESSKELELKPKPPIWAEVEKCMEQGTLDRLRNKPAKASMHVAKGPEPRTTKQKLQPPAADMTGLNRRQRRSLGVTREPETNSKPLAFAENESFGTSESQREDKVAIVSDDVESDGGFFEE